MEGSQRQLRAGFTDRLGGDDADRFSDLDHATGGEVHAVALGADTLRRFARQDGADADKVEVGGFDFFGRISY